MADTKTERQWHSIEPEEALRIANADAGGLSEGEAADRLKRFGRNTIPTQPARPWWRILPGQFMSPLIAILLIAGVVTSIQQHWLDVGAIIAVVLIAVALGFWQERKAEREVRALHAHSITNARVLRDGSVRTISAEEVVIGDIVVLESGEKVPADLRLLDVNAFEVDESMLTGESLPVSKDTDPVTENASLGDWLCMALSGTLVARGRATGLVIATGANTQIGEINRMVSARPPRTPLQILTDSLEKRIGVAILLAVVVMAGIGLASGYSFSDMFRVSVAIAVSAIPESLPVILTVAMSVAVTRMVRRGVVVRTLPAVETLGSTTVIASDKTGTLTENRLTVERLWTANGAVTAGGPPDPLTRDMLRAGALTNEAAPNAAGEIVGDSVDVAMATVALAYGAVSEDERAAPDLAHMPYEPALSFSQTVRKGADGRRMRYVKGAPDALAHMCERIATASGSEPIDRALIHQANEAFAADGLRVLATAAQELGPDEQPSMTEPPTGLVFLGLQGMTDPPRAGVEGAIADCRSAGISVKMVTGDHPVTANAIGRRLGLESSAPPLTGAEMREIDDATLSARLDETNIAARTSPRDKLRIVRVLQERGETVAVTGDGVNDAPALRSASIGIAMGKSGTDVARESSDLILTDDNFVTIVEAVREGRVTFSAIRKATFFLLSTAVAGLLAISINVMLEQPLLFLPIQILWINLVTSGIQDIALALEPAEGDELTRKPRPRTEGVLSRVLWLRTLLTGAWMGVIVVLAYTWALDAGATLDEARTFAMTTFVLSNFFQVGNARSELRSVFLLNPLHNKLLLWTSLGAIALLWAVMSWPPAANILGLSPLSLDQWAIAALIAGSVLVLVEAEKFARRLAARTGQHR
ncbi:cation-translocating P-type ATPase [Leucobacter sp. W1153]|uniref:cation-translocating P-type ATPase n=1 Tax=Leucobacter sp. W1153 TaxID=3439064 RepID=UPI003F383330